MVTDGANFRAAADRCGLQAGSLSHRAPLFTATPCASPPPQGRSVHVGLWAAGLVFQLANTAAVVLLARALKGAGAAAAAAPKAAAGSAGPQAAPLTAGHGDAAGVEDEGGEDEGGEGAGGEGGGRRQVLSFLEASLRVQGVLAPPPGGQRLGPGFVSPERKQQ